ncbi:hypothetical protein HS088_TW15G01379 [Tripterygium wilfordii]|uniref:Uncharacterized protein n=1 Tax=Tripterygium wilfordii TaxID=458696 RepID=A0A7J7CP48_TRIWF|nr:sialyltransferase-like protein 1 isoform X1 [Tripterygium wilfordii]KAF5735863.1 hypothetical protein HS088_TW15G01379 [Tripterygium wilfordii]
MSFLSSRSQRSVSPSPLSPSQISNSQHGNPHHHRSPSPSSLSTHIGSLQISDPQSPVAVADHVSGTSASAESGGSSKKVIESSDMSDVRKISNYNKWEIMPFESLRKEARDHNMQMEGVFSLYKMDGNKLDDLVCVRHSLKSEE